MIESKNIFDHPMFAELLEAYGIICEAAEAAKEYRETGKIKKVKKPLPVVCEK